MGKGKIYRILIVDDDASLRNLLCTAFKQRGVDCDAAEDGVVAQNMIRTRRYDAVISDLAMPRLHGHRLLTELIEDSSPALLFVITGILEPRLAGDLIRRGVHHVFLKPIDPAVFAEIILAYIDRRGKPGSEKGLADQTK